MVAAALLPCRGGEPQAPASELDTLLARLAERAALYESLLFKFECVEDVRLAFYKRDDKGKLRMHETFGVRRRILVEKGKEGEPKEVRLEVGKDNGVTLDAKGRPVEKELPKRFAPVADAFPHAQVAWFTAAKQAGLRFTRLAELTRERRPHRIECRPAELALEFLDAEPLRWHWASTPEGTKCDARASGQMCLETATGEVTALEFYATQPTDHGCTWDFPHPFARVELEFQEAQTGLRFPTRVETAVPRGKDVEIFTQRFQDYAFASVQVEERLGGTEPPASR